jgi:hypothetical protein
MGVETGIKDDVGSGPHRRRIEGRKGNGTSPDGTGAQAEAVNGAAYKISHPHEGADNEGFSPDQVIQEIAGVASGQRKHVFRAILGRVLGGFSSLGFKKKKLPPEQIRLPELSETREEEEEKAPFVEDPLESLLPHPKTGFYTAEEIHSGLRALIRIMETKEENMSEVNVVTTNPRIFQKCIGILESALEKFESYGYDEAQEIPMMEIAVGVSIGEIIDEEEGESFRLFEITYDEDIAALRRSHLLSEPIQLRDCFDSSARENIDKNQTYLAREKRLQEVVILLFHRYEQMLDYASYKEQWRNLEETGVIEKEGRVAIHPNIADIFSERVENPGEAIPYKEGVGQHAVSQRERIRKYLQEEERPQIPQANPLLEKLSQPKTNWQRLLDKAYKMHTFGPSALNITPESVVLGVIEEYCLDNWGLTVDELREHMGHLSIRDLLVQKGMARMISSGWAAKTGLNSPAGSDYKEVPNLEARECDIIDEYMISSRLPLSGVAYGISTMLMWEERDFSEVGLRELQTKLGTFPKRSRLGLEPGAADYMNLLRVKTLHALSRESGTIVTNWDQYFGALMEDPSVARLFTKPDANTDLWQRNIDALSNAFEESYRLSKNPRDIAISSLMRMVLRVSTGHDIPEEVKKDMLGAAQIQSRELMNTRSRDEKADEEEFLRTWERRFEGVNAASILEFIEKIQLSGDAKKTRELLNTPTTKMNRVLKVIRPYLDMMVNTSNSMRRILHLWDERFIGSLGSTFSFTKKDQDVMKHLEMIESKGGVILPVQSNGEWVFIYLYKMAPWAA